jgi:hypothetical protein
MPDVTPIDTRPIPQASEEVEPLPPPRPTPPSASGEGERFDGVTGTSERQRAGIKPVTLREVRAAQNEGFDRVVFEFVGDGASGYRVEYMDPPARQCGSGKDVAIAGAALLRVRLLPAQAHDEKGNPTIKDRERKVDLGVLRELEQICDFEGQVEWVLGLASRTPYRVLELSSPPRIVVDVKH